MAELSVLQPADGKAARCWCMAGSGMRVPGGGPRTLGTSWVPGELRGSPGSWPRACGSFTGSKDVSRGGLGPDAACCLLQPSLCRTSVVSPCSVNYSVPPAGLAAPVKALECGPSPWSRHCLAQSACCGGSRGFSAVLPMLCPWERAGEVKGV